MTSSFAGPTLPKRVLLGGLYNRFIISAFRDQEAGWWQVIYCGDHFRCFFFYPESFWEETSSLSIVLKAVDQENLFGLRVFQEKTWVPSKSLRRPAASKSFNEPKAST